VKFVEAQRYRPFALVAPRFACVDAARPQATSRPDGLLLLAAGPVAPFAAVELRVQAAGSQEPGEGVVVAGLACADGDHLLAAHDASRQRVTLELRTRANTRVLAVARADLRAPFGFAFVLCENQVTALADTGGGWQPLVTRRKNVATFVDFRDSQVLSRFRYAYGVRQAGQPSDIAHVSAGSFGMVGVRDPHLVQASDGAPYVRGGKAYLTMTCAGLGFFHQAHWGVFTLDLDDPTKLEHVAQLFFDRDGLVLGDHAGQIVVDGDQFHVLVSSWGDFAPGSIHVRRAVTTSNVLWGTHVLRTEPLRLPTDLGTWDPALTRLDDRWYVGFVASPSQGHPFDFHPALAVSAVGSAYEERLTLVGADDRLHQCEGPILARVPDGLVSTTADVVSTGSTTLTGGATRGDVVSTGSTTGEWRLLASDADAQEFPVYDLAMRRLGSLKAPYGSNIPHPQVITVPGEHELRRLMITFDGTQYAEPVMGYGGHGDLVIMAAQEFD
jgi:hypothetical protein